MKSVHKRGCSASTSICVYKRMRGMVILLVLFFFMSALSPVIAAAESDNDDSYDIEAAANTMGTIFSLGYMPTEKGGPQGVDILKNVSSAGNAGMVLTYTSKPTSFGQWIASKISASSMAYDYDAILNVKVKEGEDDTSYTSKVYEYAVYGRALNQLGFDETSIAATQHFSFVRFFGGGLMWIVYVIFSGITGIFNVALFMLQVMNPFRFLEDISKNVTADVGSQYSSQIDLSQTSYVFMVFRQLRSYLASLYVTMCNLSWAFIIPMMIALYVANMFLFRKTSGGRRLLKRILFIAFGIPLIGGTYTSFLHEVQDMFSNSGTGGYAETIIARTFIDFEGWASGSHLAVPEYIGTEMDNSSITGNTSFEDIKGKITVNVPVKFDTTNVHTESDLSIGGVLTNETLYYTQDICSKVNGMVFNENENSMGSSFISRGGWSYNSNNSTTTFDMNNKSIKDNANEKSYSDFENEVKPSSASNKKAIMTQEDQGNDIVRKKNAWIRELLQRYMSGEVYTSDQFASAIQSRMSFLSDKQSEEEGSDEESTAVYNMMKVCSKYTDFENWRDDSIWGKVTSLFSDKKGKNWEDAYPDAEPSIADVANTAFGDISIFNDGGLKVTSNYNQDSETTTLSFGSESTLTSYYKSSNGSWQNTDAHRTGLSTMSMYNYLNSDFTGTGVTVFGGGNAITNGLTRANHYSVNMVGTGLMSFVYYMSAIILMICVALIALMYSFGMFVGSVKYTFKAIMAIPMAAAGVFRYAAKFTGIVAAMIANVLITAVMYGVVCETLMAINDLIVRNPMILGLTAYLGPFAVLLMSGIIGVIVTIWVTRIILKLRKNAVNSVTEWITQIVGKFFEADGHPDPSKPKGGIRDKIASGLATGAGIAAGNAMSRGVHSIMNGGPLSGGGDGKDGDDGSNGGDSNPGANGGTGSGIEKESSENQLAHDTTNNATTGGMMMSQDHMSAAEKLGESSSDEKQNDSHNNQSVGVFGTTSRDAKTQESLNKDANSLTSLASDKKANEHYGNNTKSLQKGESQEHNKVDKNSLTALNNDKTNNTDRAEDKLKATHTGETKNLAADKMAADKKASGASGIGGQGNPAAAAVGVVSDVGHGVKNVAGDTKEAAKNLKEGDVKGAAKSLKHGVEDAAAPAAEVAVVAATGDVNTAKAAGDITKTAVAAEQNLTEKNKENGNKENNGGKQDSHGLKPVDVSNKANAVSGTSGLQKNNDSRADNQAGGMTKGVSATDAQVGDETKTSVESVQTKKPDSAPLNEQANHPVSKPEAGMSPSGSTSGKSLGNIAKETARSEMPSKNKTEAGNNDRLRAAHGGQEANKANAQPNGSFEANNSHGHNAPQAGKKTLGGNAPNVNTNPGTSGHEQAGSDSHHTASGVVPTMPSQGMPQVTQFTNTSAGGGDFGGSHMPGSAGEPSTHGRKSLSDVAGASGNTVLNQTSMQPNVSTQATKQLGGLPQPPGQNAPTQNTAAAPSAGMGSHGGQMSVPETPHTPLSDVIAGKGSTGEKGGIKKTLEAVADAAKKV